MRKKPYWLPRVLAIFYILFISIFALDAFAEGVPLTEALLAFFIHLVPTYLLMIILLVAWKWCFPGGILFIAAGLFYLFMARGMHWSAYAFLSGPPILIGALFIHSAVLQKKG